VKTVEHDIQAAAEIWKDIEGYKGEYQVSNYGNIKSVNRFVNCRNGFEYK